jgi:AraC-like DNA-binding protein
VLAEPSESAISLRHLIETAADHGLHLDEGPTAGEPAFHARVGVAHAQRLWERAVRALGPSLPLLVAGKRCEHVSPLYFAAMSCRTLGEALQLTVAHWRYVTEAFPAAAVRRGDAVHLRLEARGPLPLGARAGLEYLLAMLASGSRRLAGERWRPIELVLPHRPPIALEAWEAACGVPVRVAEGAPALAIAEATLGHPLRAELSRAAGRFFLELLERYTPRPRAPATVAERVAAALERDLRAAAPTVEQIAAELALSSRSLHRQLAAEGTSYQRVLDALRRDAAIRLARDERRPLKAIAAAVGFSDPRCFRRAFKRWTGTTPQAFRRGGPGARPERASTPFGG